MLFLDERDARGVAVRLRTLGHDAVSLHDPHDPHEAPLAGAPDAEVLVAVRLDKRALVTENVSDFRPLESTLRADGSHQAGLISTTDRQFPRGDPATTGRLIHALDAPLRGCPKRRDRALTAHSPSQPPGETGFTLIARRS